MPDQTNRADILHAIGRKFTRELEDYPDFKGAYMLLITVTPGDEEGDIMNITSNLPDGSIQRTLAFALETTLRQTPEAYKDPQ